MKINIITSYTSKVIFVAAAYFITGKLGLMLAIPPGFATTVWPPSGIALAAIILLGYRFWPGVFFGSFLINILIASNSGANLYNISPILTAASVASGAMLQALISACIIKRYVKFPSALEQSKDIGVLLLLGGPLGCLINSIIGSSTLLVAGLIKWEHFLFNWFTWWIGDTIGVIVFAPLLCILFTSHNKVNIQRKLYTALPLCILFLLTVTTFFYARSAEQKSLQNEFHNIAKEKSNHLKHYIRYSQTKLRSIKALFNTSEYISSQQFQTFVKHTIDNNKSIKAIEWIPKVTNKERLSFENKFNNNSLFSQFQIIEYDDSGNAVRAKTNEVYYPVLYIEPLVSNEKAIGYNLASNTTRLVALNKARDTGNQVATKPVNLVQDLGEFKSSILIIEPVYKLLKETTSIKQRREHLRGFVLGVFHIQGLVESILPKNNIDYALSLYDTDILSEDNLIYGNKNPHDTSIYWNDKLEIGGRNWLLKLNPTNQFLQQYRSWQVWSVSTGGLLITALFGAFLLIVTAHTAIIQRAINIKTKVIAKTQAQLKSILDSAGDGIYGLDIEGKTTFANKAAEEMTGYSIDEMLGISQHSLIHHSYPDGTPYPIKNCNIYKALHDGKSHSENSEVFWRKDGHKFPVEYISTPILDENNKISGAVVVFKDITEHVQTDQERNHLLNQLAKSNEELERFAYIASHDLKAPLRSIDTLSTWIEEDLSDALSGENKENMDALRKRVKRMDRLLDDLLEYSRVGRTNDASTKQIINGHTLIQDILILLSAPKDFIIKSDERLSIIQVYRMPLQQILFNLLNNAIKHHHKKNGTIQLNIETEGKFYRISVSDDGPGIQLDYQEQIFEMFQTLQPRDKVEGSGMGLAYVKKAVESHGGKIHLISKPGKGSTFIFTWPILAKEIQYEYSAVS